MTGAPVLGLVCCAAGGVEQVRDQLVEPFLADGWTVAVTATPTAARWLDALGLVAEYTLAAICPIRTLTRWPRPSSA